MEGQRLDQRKHRKIYEHIHSAITRGVFVPGDRVPTDVQLMREFGASRPTVARAMRELEVAGLLERCPGIGTFVRRVDALQTMPLGLLVPRRDKMGIFGPICDEIARATHSHGFHLLWANLGHGDSEKAIEQFCRQCVQQKMAGVFFAPLELEPEMEQINRQTAETLARAGIAVVLLDRDVLPFPGRSEFDLVGVDNYRIGYLQTDYLLKMGCRHIEHVAVSLSAPTVEARTEGYRRAFRFHAASYKESWVRRGDPADLEFVKGLARKIPDAFVCANDTTAATLMRSLHCLGLRVPHDVRVIGVDDDDYAHMVSPPLTTIRQPSREIGAAAVRAMTGRIEDRKMPSRDILLGCTLVVRESCGEVS